MAFLVRDDPYNTYTIFSEILTFFTPWYETYVCVGARGQEIIVFQKVLHTYYMNNPEKHLVSEEIKCQSNKKLSQVITSFQWIMDSCAAESKNLFESLLPKEKLPRNKRYTEYAYI